MMKNFVNKSRVWAFVREIGYRMNPIRRFQTDCCALAQFSVNNLHTEEEIRIALDKLMEETANEWNTGTREGGERAVFVITTMPYEKPLADKLEHIGFIKAYTFNRRNGYPKGYLDMWIYSW